MKMQFSQNISSSNHFMKKSFKQKLFLVSFYTNNVLQRIFVELTGKPLEDEIRVQRIQRSSASITVSALSTLSHVGAHIRP